MVAASGKKAKDIVGLKKDNNKWDNILLPHAKIDSFISASKPEERYIEWFNSTPELNEERKYFERIGKDISVIDKSLIEIKKEIARLENERKKLEKSESNFKNIQKLISAFNKRSETILPNITSLSTETEYDELLNEVKKIILTRPAVEAGENLGFLPGDLKEKVDPYLRPLYDALYDMLGVEQTEKLMEKGVIEIAPLAYMRGRTLEDAYVILDEAQNTTDNQMKMFLTRLGFRSKMIVTGDISQIDLPRNTTSGLIRALDILEGVKGISFIHLSAMDVVRHPVVQRIIERYDGNNE